MTFEHFVCPKAPKSYYDTGISNLFCGSEEPTKNLARARNSHLDFDHLGILRTPEMNETIGIFHFAGFRNP